MITRENYFQKIKGLDAEGFPDFLQERYLFTKEATEEHTTWEYYNQTDEVKEVVDQYLADLNDYLGPAAAKSTAKPKRQPAKKKTTVVTNKELEQRAIETAKEMIRPYVKRGDSLKSIQAGQMGVHNSRYSVDIRGDKIRVSKIEETPVNYSISLKSVYEAVSGEIDQQKTTEPKKAPHARPKKKRPVAQPEPKRRQEPKPKAPQPDKVERISEEVRFIKRYALMHEKVKSPENIRVFISSLQKAILEKRIRKTSKFAKEITYIQEALVNFYNTFREPALVKIKEDTLEHFRSIASSEKILLSVGYLKRYIGIQGKNLDKEKATRLYNLIERATVKNKIGTNDPYMKRVKNAMVSLKTFINSAKKGETLVLHEAVLNGIQSALDGCSCEKGGNQRGKPTGGHVLAGVRNDTPEIMNSVDFSRLTFNTLGFDGKWYELMGDPAPGFTAMVFGKPKLGKSFLCIDFASYLARNFGKVLYIAKEEGLDATLQTKLREKKAAHPNLDVAKSLPEDLSPFDFVFFDSATRLGLSPEDIGVLKAQYPDTGFIYIFQTIKDGNFRGSQEFQHDVDIVIEVYEKGKARQFGRFNQGGEMDVFEDESDKDYNKAA